MADEASSSSGVSFFKLGKARRIFSFLSPYKGRFAIGMLFLLLSTVTSMAFPGLAGKILDASDQGGATSEGLFDLDNIDSIAFLLLLVFAFQAVFSFFRVYLFADVSEHMLADLRQSTYRHLIRLPMSFFAERRVGELNSRIASDISLLQETFTTTLAEFLRQSLTIVIGVVLLLFYSWELTLVMLASLPIMTLAAVAFGRYIKRLSRKAQDEIASSNTIIEETLSGIANVKAFANEWFEFGRYRDRTEKVRQVAMKGAVGRAGFSAFIIFALFGVIVLVIWYGVHLREDGVISTGELLSFILYSVFIGASVGGLADQLSKLQKAVGATEELMEILEESPELPEALSDPKEQLERFKGDIRFRGLHFAYPQSEEEVLKGLDLHVNAGEQLAVVGPSGAGKSTIVSLVLRFYAPTSGNIEIDGTSFQEYPLSAYRDQFAIVPQDVLLFGGSVKENIRYGNPKASDEAVHLAAHKANAEAFIEGLNDGYDTLVGERGVKLSGGQRQRIAIARAILRDPAILILDEATSSLDSVSEKLVQEALDELMIGRTSLVIAHRLSTVQKADRILVLDQGEMVELGTHQELLAKENGLYRELSRSQFVTEEE